MRVRTSVRDLSEQKADVAVCFAHEGDEQPRGIADGRLRRDLAREMKVERFKGRSGDQVTWNVDGRYPSRRFLVIGLGPRDGDPAEAVRGGCARASRAASGFSATSLALRLPPVEGASAGALARAGAEGALLGAYQFDRYLTDSARRPTRLRSIELAAEGSAARLGKAAKLGEIGARAVCFARDLVNEAPSRMTPAVMARSAVRAARDGKLRSRVLGRTELQKLGMGALLAVSRGSREQPRVVHLTHRPAKAAGRAKRKKILLVGKGVTFDSGGLNLKPGESMLYMKMDMGGAAAVLAAMSVLHEIGCRAEVHALIGLVENMTGAGAYKPGDILETWSGKTVEVGNTDAEGRLVLCDLLAYGASKLKPTHVVDVATLTGACVVALGMRASGLFTRHESLRDGLVEAAAAAGEKLWPMPMYEEYLQLLQKGPADLRNVGGRWGGAITAALFLGEFLPRELAWAHMDIAGPAFTEEELPEAPAGATGAGVLTLLRWLEAV